MVEVFQYGTLGDGLLFFIPLFFVSSNNAVRCEKRQNEAIGAAA